MHPGQFIAHFINTAIITAIVAALVLWRYKVGVLAGMNIGGAVELPIPPPPCDACGRRRPPPRRTTCWRGSGGCADVSPSAIAVIVLVCSLPLAYLQAAAFGGTTPMHVLGQTGQFLLAAVPIAALLAAYSWRKALLYGVALLLAAARR